MGKFKSMFELAENLSIVLTKLDNELGLAQPQLVYLYFPFNGQRHSDIIVQDTVYKYKLKNKSIINLKEAYYLLLLFNPSLSLYNSGFS